MFDSLVWITSTILIFKSRHAQLVIEYLDLLSFYNKKSLKILSFGTNNYSECSLENLKWWVKFLQVKTTLNIGDWKPYCAFLSHSSEKCQVATGYSYIKAWMHVIGYIVEIEINIIRTLQIWEKINIIRTLQILLQVHAYPFNLSL